MLLDLYFISIYALYNKHLYNTGGHLDLPYIPIAEARGFTATSGKGLRNPICGLINKNMGNTKHKDWRLIMARKRAFKSSV